MTIPRGDFAPSPTPSAPVRVQLRSDAPPVAVPITHDGRNIDRELGTLEGEASGVKSRHPSESASLGTATLADITTPQGASTTYYEQPILKAPIWGAVIPAYFFTGGLAGASMALGAAAQLAGGRPLRPILTPLRWIASGAVALSAVLLVVDLGRPARFFNMLRVFRPTSPMNMGSWILTGAGATAAASAVLPLLGARRAGDAAGAASGLFGLALASYTAVLIVNTAVPAWQHGRRSLPPLFVASAAASAAAAIELTPRLGRATKAMRAFGAIAKIGELVAGIAYERELATRGASVVRSLRRGRAGALFTASRILTAASLVTSFGKMRRTSGVLGLAGAIALRFAVTEAGRASAIDPRATFEPQRAAPADV